MNSFKKLFYLEFFPRISESFILWDIFSIKSLFEPDLEKYFIFFKKKKPILTDGKSNYLL